MLLLLMQQRLTKDWSKIDRRLTEDCKWWPKIGQRLKAILRRLVSEDWPKNDESSKIGTNGINIGPKHEFIADVSINVDFNEFWLRRCATEDAERRQSRTALWSFLTGLHACQAKDLFAIIHMSHFSKHLGFSFGFGSFAPVIQCRARCCCALMFLLWTAS